MVIASANDIAASATTRFTASAAAGLDKSVEGGSYNHSLSSNKKGGCRGPFFARCPGFMVFTIFGK